jgi:hypothetical protein
MNTCIYRCINTGICCCFKTKNKYCNLHINNRNIVYEIIDKAIDNKNKITNNDIYKIYKFIYDNDDIYVKELIFKKIINSLFNKIYKLLILYPYLKNNNYRNINELINKIYNLNKRTYELRENNIIKKIEKRIKYYIIRNHIYKKEIKNKINNKIEPFTLDNIENIEINERFIYNDGINYYCFKAQELLYFIENKGNNWNPYTKKEFDEKIIRNLKIFINYFILTNDSIQDIYKWNTIIQAYTDVSQSIEKIGFYTNTEWFLKLTTKDIKNIIRLFKLLSVYIEENNNYFDISNINENTIFYDFARESIKLFDDGNNNFLLCCNYMKSLAMYSLDFYNNLPEWMTDIHNPLQIENTNILIFYDI